MQRGIEWLNLHNDRLSGHDLEWLQMLESWPVVKVAEILEAPHEEGQRLRSGMPFKGEPFITVKQTEAIRERAYLG